MTLPAEGATLVTRRAVRTVVSFMLQMAWDEGYRGDNPVKTIELKKSPTKRVLVSTHAQWNRLESALPFRAAQVYARLNVTTWARQCEMRTFRPRDFEFGSTTMINITRSASYVTAENHPDGHAGWVVHPNSKNGDWRRFATSTQMTAMLREHIEENQIGDQDLLYPQWMFAGHPASLGPLIQVTRQVRRPEAELLSEAQRVQSPFLALGDDPSCGPFPVLPAEGLYGDGCGQERKGAPAVAGLLPQ